MSEGEYKQMRRKICPYHKGRVVISMFERHVKVCRAKSPAERAFYMIKRTWPKPGQIPSVCPKPSCR
jgi:hypothetical protein